MFFSCYLGKKGDNAQWQAALTDHARWLGLFVHVESRPCREEEIFSAAWLTPSAEPGFWPLMKTPEEWSCSTDTGLADEAALTAEIGRAQKSGPFTYPDSPLISFNFSTGALRIAVPPTAPEQCYIAADHRGLVMANDLRLLRRWKPCPLNPAAVYALLQFRAIPPALSLYSGIERIPNGHQLIGRAGETKTAFSPFFFPARADGRAEMGHISEEEALRRFQERLDENLQNLPTPALLFFSGGVDSTLLAARFATLGRREVQLINFSFGPDDTEAQLALDMAALLGLPIEQLTYHEEEFPAMLTRIGREFSFPFGDSSAIPVNLMIHAILPRFGSASTVIEGVGPDQTFGAKLQDKKWGWAENMPAIMRGAASAVYKGMGLWKNESPAGTMTNILRKRWQMPRHQAQIMAINALDAIAYTIPAPARSELDRAIHLHYQALGEGLDANDQSCLVNLLHFSIGTVCAKSTDLYRMHGLRPVNPFMAREVLELSFSLPHHVRCANGESKSLLKKMVTRSVPPALIYRPKQGFDPPLARMAREPVMLDYLHRVVLNDANPLLEYLHKPVVKKMVGMIEKGQRLSYDAYRFIWVVLFTSIWLDQQD